MDDADIARFLSDWSLSAPSERSHKDTFLNELCDVLGVPRPDKKVEGDPAEHRYVFEREVRSFEVGSVGGAGGAVHTRRIDLYKEGCFLLEAKQFPAEDSRKKGLPRRGTPAWEVAMRMDALGQAVRYAAGLDRPPPFLIVCDIGHCFDLYASFDGTAAYRPFPNAERQRVPFARLRDQAQRETLRRIWLDPLSLDPAKHAARVTREVAGHIAVLAQQLESSGQDPERVARFLMRCLFTMFAEDIELLPAHAFTNALEKNWIRNPASFPVLVEQLWKAMNSGELLFSIGKILEFNGGLFREAEALPLTKEQLKILLEAAKCDWSGVEPAIFGTLLERALNPKKRHQLGAHYTPRAYVERLVRPTIEEPLRAEWESVQAAVRTMMKGAESEEPAPVPTDKRRRKKGPAPDDPLARAREAVRGFHKKLCAIRVLDPACGSGNFLYVALDLFMRLEGEVIALAKALGDHTQGMFEGEAQSVTPAQFLGIEVQPWAKEIAEMVLWIGYLQWFWRTRQSSDSAIKEPILHDYRNIERRDAILAYDREELVLDATGKPVTRWDGETMTKSPATGRKVPDEAAQIPIYRYLNPRPAQWPKADYVVGNPPYIGTRRMRLTLGDGVVNALCAAIPGVPETADYVMYWWDHAATLAEAGAIQRFGFITTNSITQTFNRAVLSKHLESENFSVLFAIADHPWVDSRDGAAVRVAMTVGGGAREAGRLLRVVSETPGSDGEHEVELNGLRVGAITADLRIGASAAQAAALRANERIAYWGVKFYGDGFILDRAKAEQLGGASSIIRPFVSGRDLTGAPRGLFAIDCDGLSEEQLMESHPDVYQHLRETVKPVRAHNPRAFKRERWWIFGENQPGMRQAIAGLPRYIVTTETAKHRVFHFMDRSVLSEGTVTVIASGDAFVMGVLSSHTHVTWALAAGGRLGVGNDPRYNKTRCFDPFPFPDCIETHKARIRKLGEMLDKHRKDRQREHPEVTITGMYNLLEKRRKKIMFTEADRAFDRMALTAVLQKIHDDLDAAVLDAYGWPHDLPDEEILDRLVTLNAERAAEEKDGLVRWLRPDFQNPTARSTANATQVALPGAEAPEPAEAAPAAPAEGPSKWPERLPEQAAALRDWFLRRAGWFTAAEVAASFEGAPPEAVGELLESLWALGLLDHYGDAFRRS